jgi:DNA-binding CsgD family transcriptional regulator/predicted negative regulator of RcsB-dependent stress response
MTIGRDRERAAITRLLDPQGAEGCVVLLEGEAGIGKTTLWNAGVDAARAAGFTTLTAVAAASETQLSFTALRDLLDGVFDTIAAELAEPRRRALAVALLREEPPARPLEPGAISVAFLEAVRVLAARNHLLVAVDDVQWLDPASAEVLAYVLRRLDGEPVAALLTRRADHTDTLALERLEPARVRTIDVGPLSVGALGRILHDRLGVALPRPTLHRVVDAAGGNPFFALELARALGTAVARPAPGAPLPVPATLHELVSDRLSALPSPTLEVLAYAAAAARPTLAAVGLAAGVDASHRLEPAIAAHVVDVQGDAIHFVHPLFAAGAYGLADPAQRRHIHGRLASGTRDVEERARHLALATEQPDADVSAALEYAARRTRIRGDRVVAAQLFHDAARLTPDDEHDSRARRLLSAAGAVFEAGDTEGARELLEQVVAEVADGDLAAEANWRLGTVLAETGSSERPLQLWRTALALAVNPSLAADIQRSMAVATIYAGHADDAVEHARGALATAEASGDAETLAFALSTRALTAAITGDAAWRAYLDRALELESTLYLASSAWSPTAVAGECAVLAVDVDDALLHLSRVLDDAVENGNVEMELWAAHRLATAHLAAGDAHAARALIDLVLELADATGQMRLPAARLSAEIDAHFGHADDARERLETVVREAERDGWDRHLLLAHVALGALHLSCGEFDAATDNLAAGRRLAEANGARNAALLLALVDEVEAAVGAGRPDDARDALARAIALRDAAPWAEPLVLRAEAALQPPSEAEATLMRAATAEATSLLPLQRGRTLVALGSVQRRLRKRRAARETLQSALAIFEELEAACWAEQARTELARIGGRTSSGDELTPSEHRIATLVAEGKKNREVAAALVVTERTVETALTQIYRKLDVRSRTELARKLARSD